MAAGAGVGVEVDSTTIAETGKSPLAVGATIVINDKNKGGVANNNKKSSADEQIFLYLQCGGMLFAVTIV